MEKVTGGGEREKGDAASGQNNYSVEQVAVALFRLYDAGLVNRKPIMVTGGGISYAVGDQ